MLNLALTGIENGMEWKERAEQVVFTEKAKKSNENNKKNWRDAVDGWWMMLLNEGEGKNIVVGNRINTPLRIKCLFHFISFQEQIKPIITTCARCFSFFRRLFPTLPHFFFFKSFQIFVLLFSFNQFFSYSLRSRAVFVVYVFFYVCRDDLCLCVCKCMCVVTYIVS